MPGPSDVTPRTVQSVLVETPVRGKVLEALVGRCVWEGRGRPSQGTAPRGPRVQTGQRKAKLLEDGHPCPLRLLATWRSRNKGAGHWGVRQAGEWAWGLLSLLLSEMGP